MKRNLLLVLAIFAVNTIFAQQMWEKIYNGKSLSVMTLLPGEKYVLAGSEYNDPWSDWDIIQTNDDGTIQWDTSYSVNARMTGTIEATPDSGYIVAGYDDSNVWLTKYDKHNHPEWQSSFLIQSGGLPEINSIHCTENGEYLLTGTHSNSAFYAKLTTTGDTVWTKTTLASDYGRGRIIMDAYDGGYTGIFSTAYGGAFFTNINEQGDTTIFKMIDADMIPYSAIATVDSCYLLAGGSVNQTSVFIKIDKNGNKLWKKTHQGSMNYSLCTSVYQTTDGGFISANAVSDDPQNSLYLRLLKLDATGNSVFSFTTANTLMPGKVIQTSDGYFALNAMDKNDVPRLIKTDSTGSVITGITKNALENKELSCYPNPFTDEITVVIPENAGEGESISIYDMQGRLVKQKQIISSGSISLKTGSMKPGVYFLELTNDDVRYIKKIVKL